MSARSVKLSKAGTDYIEKYLKTQIANGNLHILNSTGDSLYHIIGSQILDDVNLFLPSLSGDDTVATQNTNNQFGGVQTFNQGMVTQGGLLVLPDPLGVLDDDVILTDGINMTLGTGQGTTIGTSPSQMLAFFGSTPVNQQTSGSSAAAATTLTNIFDIWDSLITLGLLSAPLSTGSQDITESIAPTSNPPSGTRRLYADSTLHALGVLDSAGVFHNFESAPITGGLPSQVGGRWGTYQGSSTAFSGEGLLTDLTKTSNTGTLASTFINNRPATNFPSGSSSGNWGGFRSTNKIVTLKNNPTMIFKVAMSTNTNSRLILGLADSTSLGTGFSTILNSSLNGIMIGFGSGDTAYSVVTNNGGTSQTNNTTSMPTLQTAGTSAIFKLSWVDSTTTLTWSVQTAAATTTTGTISTGNLPADTVQMYLYCTLQTATGSSETLTVENVEIQLGSDYQVF